MKFQEKFFHWIIMMPYLLYVNAGLNIVYMHQNCGQTIISDGGKVLLDTHDLADILPDNKCKVTISGQMTSSFQYYVMFYFTKFNMTGRACEEALVLLSDDRYGFTNTGVVGIPDYLCGSNRDLEKDGQFYFTSNELLTLTYERKGQGQNYHGEFALKYVSFHKGNCDKTKEYQCPSSRCVPTKFHCGGELAACGVDEKETCKPTIPHEDRENPTVLETLYSFIPLVVILAVGLPIKFRDNIRAFCGCPKRQSPEDMVTFNAEEGRAEDGLSTNRNSAVSARSQTEPSIRSDLGVNDDIRGDCSRCSSIADVSGSSRPIERDNGGHSGDVICDQTVSPTLNYGSISTSDVILHDSFQSD